MPDTPKEPTRIGFLIDGDPDTELMTALYEHDTLGVRLTVPYHVWIEDLSGRWWSEGTSFADDPDRTKYSYSPPTELDYYDNKGTVGLIGCRSGPTTFKIGGGGPDAGVGTIRASFAIEGAGWANHYLRPNGLRSEIDGLAYWLGHSALRSTFTFNENGSGGAMTTTAAPVDDMELNRALNLRALARATRSGLQTPEVAYQSQVLLRTFTKAPREWSDHLTLHFGVRDLLRIAAWRPLNFQSHEVASSKEIFVLREVEQQPWYPVRTADTAISEAAWTIGDRFLFSYADIDRVGVARWLRLAKQYAREIDPLVRLLDLEGATLDAHVMQLGIAMEAIGYQALIDAGRPPGSANSASVKRRVDFLLVEVGSAIQFNAATFAQDFADSYNSVKHANRSPVAPATKLEHYRQGVQLLRAWIGLRLGLRRAVLRDRW